MKPKVATIWLGGCSGCHMSFLDLDERLIDLADKIELVYSPIADVKEFPRDVDVTLVEGAVASYEHEDLARLIRRNSRFVVSFGDCAVTGNVTAMRNPLGGAEAVLERAYLDPANLRPQITALAGGLPPLMPRVLPLHEVVAVEYFLPGCPPSASRIKAALKEIAANRAPGLAGVDLTFG